MLLKLLTYCIYNIKQRDTSILHVLLFSKPPRLSTQWTLLLNVLLALEPLHDALHVEGVTAFAPHWGAVVTGEFLARAAGLVRIAANSTYLSVNHSPEEEYNRKLACVSREYGNAQNKTVL